MLKVAFNTKRRLYRVKLRAKSGGKGKTVYRYGEFSFDVADLVKKEYGDQYYVEHPKRMTVEQVINMACKYLPELDQK